MINQNQRPEATVTVVTRPEFTKEYLRLIGDPQELMRNLEKVQRSGRFLSSDEPRLIDEYENRWIAVYDGAVIASANSLDELLAVVNPAKRRHSLLRWMRRDEPTLIL